MSSLSVPTTNNVNRPHFINDTTGVIYKMLADDETAVLTSALICRAWRDNPVLIKMREQIKFRHLSEIEGIPHRYPRPLVNVFRESGMPIHDLPVLDFQNFCERRLDPSNMTHPIMRFRDNLGRPGIVLAIEGHQQKLIIIHQHSDNKDNLIIRAAPLRSGFAPTMEAESYPILASILNGTNQNCKIATGVRPVEKPISKKVILITSLAALAISYLANFWSAEGS